MSIIAEKLSVFDLLCQCAEEAAELAQACCKLQRIYGGSNPTPVSADEAMAALVEEIADVDVAADALRKKLGIDWFEVLRIKHEKITRWEERIENGV